MTTLFDPTASTAIWPPDWSSFWPDMLVALFTGVFVGIAVLLAERNIDARARRREVARRKTELVDRYRFDLMSPLVFDAETLLPDPVILKRLQRAMRGLPVEGDNRVLGMRTIRRMLDSWDALKISTSKLDRDLPRYARSMVQEMPPKILRPSAREMEARIRRVISEGASSPATFEVPQALRALTGIPEWEMPEDLYILINEYLDARVTLEASQVAFTKANTAEWPSEKETLLAMVKLRAQPPDKIRKMLLPRGLKFLYPLVPENYAAWRLGADMRRRSADHAAAQARAEISTFHDEYHRMRYGS